MLESACGRGVAEGRTRVLACHMKVNPESIARLQDRALHKGDPAYGRGVAEALGLAVEEPELASVR